MGKPLAWGSLDEIRKKVNKSPFYKTISMEVVEVDKRGSLIRIKSGVKHKNLWGTIHGGALAALMDSSCGLSVAPYLKSGETVVTISLHIDYIAPVVKGELIGRGRMIHRGSRLARAEATLVDEEERLIAKGYASFMISADNTKK